MKLTLANPMDRLAAKLTPLSDAKLLELLQMNESLRPTQAEVAKATGNYRAVEALNMTGAALATELERRYPAVLEDMDAWADSDDYSTTYAEALVAALADLGVTR